jgi:hypothetical protein
LDDQLGILLGQLLKLFIAGDRVLQSGRLVPRNVTGHVFAVLPGLVLEIRAIGSFAQHGELAPFHLLDVGDLLEEILGVRGGVHDEISSTLDIPCP